MSGKKSAARHLGILMVSGLIIGCGGGSSSGSNDDSQTSTVTTTQATQVTRPGPLDIELANLIEAAGLLGDASFNRSLPQITDPMAQLGKKLFFSKSLGGDFDSACVSCHHPVLGGSDQLTLPIGTGAANPDILGSGRQHADTGLPNVPRNSPSVFNAGLWDAGMFHDSRIESFGKEEQANGSVSDIRTPDVELGAADLNAGPNLPSAQARFPVTSQEEMRGSSFEASGDNDAVRNHLAARLGNYGVGTNELPSSTWLTEFQSAFGPGTAEELITFDNIALALGEYERSMVFTDNPFRAYLEGDLDAITDDQKRGAILFYTAADDGGGGCSSCHSGDFFTDEEHHTIAFPQFGPGKGDGLEDDFGRARETGLSSDRYAFRTPSLLNITVTAPYGHAGTYETLDEVLAHYNNPNNTLENFFEQSACGLSQFADLPNCEELYPTAETNSQEALRKLQAERRADTSLFQDTDLNNSERTEIIAFLNTLTDPCVLDRACLAPWIANPEDDPDGQQLVALDANGNPL